MQRLIGYVMEKFGELGPVRRLFKFFFGRIFSNLIDREIKLSDFKNHILELENLPLSVQKINKIYLSESPYCLHSGIIGKLKIKLASFKELTTKDIEVAIDRIHLVFKFNPSYCKPKGTQQSQSLSTEPDVQDIDLQDDDDDDEDLEEEKQAKKNQQPNQQKKGKKDMFKQFIRQVLSNIKFSVNGITIDLFMNEPASEKEKTISQVFLRLHLQKLKIYQQKKDAVLKKLRVAKDEGDNLYWIKLRELSAFILNEKDHSNKIPTIDNPACIFACSFKMKQIKQAVEDSNKEGFKNLNSSYFFDWTASVAERDMTGQNQDDEAFLPNHFQIELLFNPNDGRVKGLKVYLPPVELQVDPIQFRVLRNYLEQLQAYDQMRRLSEFKKSGFKELDLFPLKMRYQESEFQEEEKSADQQSLAIPIIANHNKFQDHFCFSEADKNNIQQNQEIPLSDQSKNNIADNPANSINKVIDDEFSFTNMMSNEIEFDFYESQLDFKILAVNAYFLKKKISQNGQKRGWIYYYNENPEMKVQQQQQQYQPSQRICTSLNDQIPTNYFMFSLKLLQLQTQSKLLKTLYLQSVKILDVSLVESKGLCNIKPDVRRHSGQQIPQLFGAPPPSNTQLFFSSSQKFNFGKTNSPKRPRQNMYSSIRQSPPLAPITAQCPSNCDLSSSMFQSCIDNNEMTLTSKKSDISEEKNINMQVNNQDDLDDEDLFKSFDNNSQLFQSAVSQFRIGNQQLEKIEEEDKLGEIEGRLSSDGVQQPKESINNNNNNNNNLQSQYAQVKKEIESPRRLSQKEQVADWRLDPERQHYCVSYILLIKPLKIDQQHRTSNHKGNTLNEVGGAFKEKLLAQSSWNRDLSNNNNNKNKSDSISNIFQHAFSAQLVKKGSDIKIEGVLSQVFIAGHYNLLKDITQILLNEQSPEWREYSSNLMAIDKKLLTSDSIQKLQEFNAEQGKILLFEEKGENKENTNNNNTNSNNMKNVNIQVSIKSVKCGWLPYRDLLKENEEQQRKCFCDVLRYPRANKSYGIVVEIKDMQVQSGVLNYSQANSNISSNNNSSNQNSQIQVNISQVTAGLIKLSRTATLDTSKELFTIFPIMEIMKIKLSLSQLASRMQLNFQAETISLCVWKLNTILDLSKAMSQQFETLHLLNNQDPSDSTDDLKKACEEKIQKPNAQMLEYQKHQEEELSVELNVKEFQLRFAYSQKWKNDKKNGLIPSKSQQQLGQDKHTLGSWIGACPKSQQKQKIQTYYAVTQLSISQNYTLELLFLNTFLRVNSSSNVSSQIENTCRLECAVFEIYLIDNQQSLVHLSDYQYPTMLDRQQIFSQKTQIGFSREVNDYKLLVYSASSCQPQQAQKYWNNYISEQDGNYSRISNPAGSKINRQLSPERNLNLNEDSNTKPFLNLRLLIKSTRASLSGQNKQFFQKQNSNNNSTSTTMTMVKISTLNIGNVNVRFGDFSSRPAENILYHISHFQTPEKQPEDENQPGEKAQPSALLEIPQPFAIAGSQLKVAPQTSSMSIFLKNGCLHDIMIDLFPLHDNSIRKSFPKVFEGISSSNVNKSYWTNQRSVLNIKQVQISLFQYDSSSSQIAANAQIQGIELLTLVFNDFNILMNPLLLRTYQLPLLQQNPPAQTQLLMLNDYIYTLGFTPIFEIDASVSLDSTNVKLQIKRCQLGACKDSFSALPLHFAILSLLVKRLLDINSNGSNYNEKDSLQQSADSRIKDSKISSKVNNNQGSELKVQNNQESLLKSDNSQQQKGDNKNMQEQYYFEQKDDKKDIFDEDEFVEIDEEFMLNINRSEEAGEKAKKKFIQDAKEKDILYFHKQGMENEREIKYKIDFSIENLEIQLFSGRNFDFEEPNSFGGGNISSSIRNVSNSTSNIRNLNNQDSQISIPAVGNNSYLRHRRTEKSYNQSLNLSLNGLQVLYSQSSQKQKLNLVIQAISIAGTAEGKSSTILQKKDNNNNNNNNSNNQPMVLTDILIDDEKNQVFIKANIARLKLIVDKAYKNLFEDLSQIKLDPKCTSNENNEDQSLYVSEIREFDDDDNHRDQEERQKQQLFQSNDNEDDDDDEYEICESESVNQNNNMQSSSSQYKLCLLQINGLQCEITVNWVLSSILKDSLLQWDELYLENEKGREINSALSEKIINHYTQLFSKNQQLIKILTDLVLIRNISNLAKGVADLFILPYTSYVSRDAKLTDGILQGVKGLQNTLLTETRNLFSLARSIYSTCIRQNLNPIKRIKKLFKPNKK